MDKTPREPGDSPELDELLKEFDRVMNQGAAGAAQEPEEPTLRLYDRDGKLVRERPLEPAKEEAPAPSAPEDAPEEDAPEEEAPQPQDEEPPAEKETEKTRWWERRPQAVHLSEKVIEFPEEDRSVTARIGRLIEKGGRYAEGMFQGDEPADPERERQDRLLPGVDWEHEPTHVPTPRRRRLARRPKPDVPPAKLAQRYKKGLPFLHTRTFLAFLAALPQIYLMLWSDLHLPMLPVLAGNRGLCLQVSALALAVSALLALDVVIYGVTCLIRMRLEGETLLLFAAVAAVGDALTMPILGDRGGAMPYCGVVAVCFFFALWGRLLKRRGLWQSCRAAAGAAEPYLVTLDEKMWDGRDAFVKWPGTAEGYGSQIQETDGVQRVYHAAAPAIIIAAMLLALIASAGRQRPECFFWCLSAAMTAGCGFATFLSFSLPFAALAQRLAQVGAALGSWDGVSWKGRRHGVVLTDSDLFPPGSVTLNGTKVPGVVTYATALSYTATLIRETGSALEKPFADLMKAEGVVYRRADHVVCHEGGVTGIISGQNVCVGSASFMELMRVNVDEGMRARGRVFCAVDGQLAGIFVLNYNLPDAVRPALEALIANGLDPILATRDFLIIPETLYQRFKLPVNKMEFPSLDRRRELSSRRQEHEKVLSAVLCREGLSSYADAVVGGKRLLWGVRVGLFFDLLGTVCGMALSFYLCLAQAYAALSAGTMLVFLGLWLVPSVLVAGWVDRY